MGLTRREFIGTAAAALLTPGIYGRVEELAGRPPGRRGGARAPGGRGAGRGPAGQRGGPPFEQHLIKDMQFFTDSTVDEAVQVLLPPLHHQVVTGVLRVPKRRKALGEARRTLEKALRDIEKDFDPTPSGLVVTVAWGLPYFREYVPRLRNGSRYPGYLPADYSAAANGKVRAVVDAVAFPSDPEDVALEENDIAVLFRSDSLANIRKASERLYDAIEGMVELTSIRRGFVGGGFGGAKSLPKRMAMAAGVPGAESIPATAQLFMGFTSTQKSMLGPGRIANFEALPGMTDQWPGGYWRQGTAMHLSHLFIDLEQWYSLDFGERVGRMFRPGITVPENRQTVSPRLIGIQSSEDVMADSSNRAAIGHTGAISAAVRLPTEVVDNYGERYPRGTAVPQRADFNTLDNPFLWTSRPKVDGYSPDAAAGLHFVVFTPTSTAFHRGRLAMDGHLPGGKTVSIKPRTAGINSVLRTSHRQNFVVPPRPRRSFPLAELI